MTPKRRVGWREEGGEGWARNNQPAHEPVAAANQEVMSEGT